MKNEELKTQLKAQEEIAAKRLQNKLNRDKNPEINELLANEEMVISHNADIGNKLRMEKEKFDTYLGQRLEIEEKLRLTEEQLKEDTEKVGTQNDELADLRARIKAEQAEVDEVTAAVEEGRKLNKREDEKNRQLS